MKRIVLVAIMAIFMNSAFAEGYQVNLQSARQTGMGHVGTAMKLGAESMHFNPAALSFMDTKWDFSGGGALIFSKTDLTVSPMSLETPLGDVDLWGESQHETNNPTSTPFFLYGAYKINDKLAVGLAANSPYGSSLSWGEEWHPVGSAVVEEISLQAIYIQPTVSYRINEKLSFGAGLDIAFGSLDMYQDKSVDGDDSNYRTQLSGSTSALGYNLGVFYDVNDKVSLGVNYRSQIDIELEEGTATLIKDGEEVGSEGFVSGLPMPANLTIGATWMPSEKWLLSADIQHVFWSAYESLEFDFETSEDIFIAKNWSNSTAYRIGAEYYASEAWTARVGFYYDSTPLNMENYGPETPGMNKIGISAGTSWNVSDRFAVDAAVLYNLGLGSEGTMTVDEVAGLPVNFGGDYSYSALMPTVAFRYSF